MKLSIDTGTSSLLATVNSFLAERGIRSYLVGGFIRDALLKRETADIDIALAADALEIAPGIADALGGRFIRLDEVNRMGRVVVAGQAPSGGRWQLDFSAFEGGIEQDLGRRDFTIDAMAVDLGELTRDDINLIDPFNGRTDLEDKIIRAVSGAVFSSDAARLLRAVRLAAELDFTIEPEIPIAARAGSVWNIQYRFGAETWGFEAVTVSSSNNVLVLSHSDKVRFVNRRRFLRAPVELRALIGLFPSITKGEFEQPEFVEGRVTELSGPGLKIEAPLEVIEGQRVLVIFELQEGRLVQDTAVVRWSRDDIAYQTIGLELTGLDETSINQLIRATNNSITAQRIAEIEREEELAGVGIND